MTKPAIPKYSKMKFVIKVYAFIHIFIGIITLLAFPLVILYTITTNGGIPVKSGKVIIEKINPNSPAAMTMLSPGDRIISVNGKSITQSMEFSSLVRQAAVNRLTIDVDSVSGKKTVEIIPREKYPQGEGPTGLVLRDTELKTGNSLVLVGSELWNIGKKDLSVFLGLLLALANIILALGLIKLRKWGLYGFILLSILGLILHIWMFNTKGPSFIFENTATFATSIAISLIIVVFLYSQNKLFD